MKTYYIIRNWEDGQKLFFWCASLKKWSQNLEHATRYDAGLPPDSNTMEKLREQYPHVEIVEKMPDGRLLRDNQNHSPVVDPVNHPLHYTQHPSGVECIDITRHMGFNLGNALKYIWRADLKEKPIEDIQKAVWYLQDELKKRRLQNERT